ncbi:Gfo/Idh/MocA family oxidoreductase [Maioricimonas sp. JC845]|uniref:Gfo/Idh/MocA family protein n=1 Tax=Maioricimonas sp. JC845 TaxID=3232138 RepID=UPI003459C8AD
MKYSNLTRREFLTRTSAAAFVAPWLATGTARAANEIVNIACVGVGGKGWSDMNETAAGHRIVAICDIDDQRLARAGERFPEAKKYTDWRKLLEQPNIDAVTISTPDHMHAIVTAAAMKQGKHVYTQKPLTHTVHEARRLTEIAAEQGVVTQMGTQHHATARLKIAVQTIRDGVIGKVSEVHTWTDRPGNFWKQGLERPDRSDPVPAHVHWNDWLGVAPERPYVEGLYHPFHWRGWWDFGTGALGDMGCHILDPVVNALELPAPKMIRAEGPPPHPESGPLWCIVNYEFPGTAHTTDTLKLTWYEAGKQPPREIFKAPEGWAGSKNGVLFVGEKGNLFVGFPEMPELFPKEDFADHKWPEFENHNHYTEWTSAIVGDGKTGCPFSYSGPLTETVLLGNVAYRSGAPVEWDSKNLKVKGNEAAESFLNREYRDGWDVGSLEG